MAKGQAQAQAGKPKETPETFGLATGAQDLGVEEGDGFTVDFSGVNENQQYEPLPRGIYPVEVEACDFKYSQSNNNPMWAIKLAVTHPDHTKKKLFLNLTFTEGGFPRVKRFLVRIAGEDQEAINRLCSGRFSPEKVANDGILLGARCRVRVDVRKYDNQLRNEVKDVLPMEAGGGFGVS